MKAPDPGKELVIRQAVEWGFKVRQSRRLPAGDQDVYRLRRLSLAQRARQLESNEPAHAMSKECERLVKHWLEHANERLHERPQR
jgi:hypothetical protein